MTQEEVARRAKVSTATVSRVLNNAAGVKRATRARVMAAIERFKFSPDLNARSLAAGKNRCLGIIVSNLENPFFLDIYKAAESGARDAGYDVLIASTGYNPESLAASVRLMLGHRVSGVAAMVSEMDPRVIEELAGNGIPIVFYDGGAPRRNALRISIDYRRAMEKLVSYLYDLGHRRVGFVCHQVNFGVVNERLCALRHVASSFPDFQVATAADADSLEGGRRAARAVLAQNPGITALLCENDWMAVGALRALRESGLRVPRDISVTGFDNINLAQFCVPALTSVHIPRDWIGQTICDYLINREKLPLLDEFMIDPELVVRDSTGPAPTCD